jgi:nucleotide-binding universal stress UspA family protein
MTMNTQPDRPMVVVGIDGSDGARRALTEAVRSAARRGAGVRAVAVFEPSEPWGPWSFEPGSAFGLPERAEMEREKSAATHQMVSEVLAGLRGELGSTPEVEVEVLPGRPAEVLLDRARGAVELVVGHRGRGAVAGALLGSVGWACVLHAPCAVTVVSTGGEKSSTPTVVVGVDGSDNAGVALRYGWQQAAWRHARLRVVMAYEAPDAWAASYGVPDLPNGEWLRTRMRDELTGIVEEVRATLSPDLRAVPWEVAAEIGSPSRVLADESRSADLLVVGHRGRGGLRSALLGSVGLGCVLQAACPTTVVPMPVPSGAESGRLRDTERADAPAVASPLPVGPIA